MAAVLGEKQRAKDIVIAVHDAWQTIERLS